MPAYLYLRLSGIRPPPRLYVSLSPHMLHCLQIFIWAVDKENMNGEF